MDPTFLWNLMFLLFGAFATFYAARKYYEKASEDLRKESEELQRLNNLILMALEEGGLASISRDADGRATGLNLIIEGKTVALSFKSESPTPRIDPVGK